MTLTPTELRKNLYRILDDVLSSGTPVEIERNGRIVRLVPDVATGSLDALEAHPGFVVGDPEDLVHVDWSSTWKP